MIEVLWYKFISAWVLGLIAAILGRYVGRTGVRFPEKWGARGAVFLQIWGFTFLAVLVFGYAGHLFGLQERTQTSFAEFLLPIIAGAYFCRQVLIRRMADSNGIRKKAP
jgi:cytochrome c biogenesis protein CcdA